MSRSLIRLGVAVILAYALFLVISGNITSPIDVPPNILYILFALLIVISILEVGHVFNSSLRG